MSLHDGGGVFDADECRAKKQSDCLVEGVHRDVLDRGEHAGAAGVAHHAVEPSELVKRQIDGGLDVSFTRDVCVKVECVPAQFPGDGLALLVVDVSHDNARAFLNEQSG